MTQSVFPGGDFQEKSEKGVASGYASLDASTKVVEDPANATAVAGASKIPIADGSGKLDTWVSDATTAAKGKVELATDGESAANVVVQGNDSRMSDARTPTSHAASHLSGGGDAIKLDDLATPDDNTDLDASTTRHGLLPKLTGSASDVFKGDGTWGAGAGGSWTTIIKPADTARTNNTLSGDPDLVLALTANTNYAIRFQMFFTTNTTADCQYRLAFTGTTTRVRRRIIRTATGDIPAFITIGTAFDAAGVVLSTTGTNPFVEEELVLQVGASGGTLFLNWAQVTTNGSPCTCLEGSYLEYAVT